MTFTSTKGERAALAGSSTATTLFQQATAHLELEESGRFGALARERAAKPYVTGTEACAKYPGAASWTEAAQMLEPPLGFSVEDMVPSGEHFEIAASVATPTSSPGLARGGEDVSGVALEGSAATASPPSPTAAAHERLAQILPNAIRRRKLR